MLLGRVNPLGTAEPVPRAGALATTGDRSQGSQGGKAVADICVGRPLPDLPWAQAASPLLLAMGCKCPGMACVRVMHLQGPICSYESSPSFPSTITAININVLFATYRRSKHFILTIRQLFIMPVLQKRTRKQGRVK